MNPAASAPRAAKAAAGCGESWTGWWWATLGDAEQFGPTIPTIDEMCKAVGATSANLESCKNDESAAAEFVIAWMGLHGFVANGTIDVGMIQLAADLGTDPASPLTNPDV